MMASRKAPLACSSPATSPNHTPPTRRTVSSMARKRLQDVIKNLKIKKHTHVQIKKMLPSWLQTSWIVRLQLAVLLLHFAHPFDL